MDAEDYDEAVRLFNALTDRQKRTFIELFLDAHSDGDNAEDERTEADPHTKLATRPAQH